VIRGAQVDTLPCRDAVPRTPPPPAKRRSKRPPTLRSMRWSTNPWPPSAPSWRTTN